MASYHLEWPTRIAGPGPTRIWSHWQEWYATSGCAKASLCPLKHGMMAVGWHSLPGSRVGPFSATAHLSCMTETLQTSSVYNQKILSGMNSRQSWPLPLWHKRGTNWCQAPPSLHLPPCRMLARKPELASHVHVRPDSQRGISAGGTHGCFPNASVRQRGAALKHA